MRRVFKQAGTELVVLDGIDLVLRPGEAVALVGPSGAGKSTLLHIAGLLERPDAGAVLIGGRECGSLPDERRTLMRRCELGFVYQFHHLLPEFSALENIMLAQMIAGLPRRRAREKAALLLDRVGLARRAGHRPARLSGGEQQRVAIARALVVEPRVVLADEPTGNLDSKTGGDIVELLARTASSHGATVIVATHDVRLAEQAPRRVSIRDGRIATPAVTV
ncbi:MAG TPA: ABC transporter ATP-binding protein [Stellaceae bacterium]|nr:ABC transporter ATP-binding protein [Stellaceae bacterium]